MKKLLLGLFISISLNSFAVPGVFYIYSNCNGERQFIEEIWESVKIVNGTPVPGNYTPKICPTLCQGCKLEIYFGYDWKNGTYDDAIKSFPINFGSYMLNSDNSGVKKLNTENDRYYIEFDLASFNPSFNNQSIGINGIWLEWQCMTLIPTNNKDNLTIDNKQICKGDCLNMNGIISNLFDPNFVAKADVVSFGCINPITPSYVWGNNNLNNHLECFNDVGSFPICATVKDVCGVKNLTGNINVIDCTNGTNGLNCETCCNLMNNITSVTIGNWFLGGNLMLPDEFFGCGPLDVYIYFSDGTSIVARGSGLVNLGGKTITSICFVPALGCNSCAKCIQLGG